MQARTDGLIVEELGQETIVYDLHAKKAHCLNDPVRWIWRQCNGQRGTAEIAAEFAKRYPGADGAESVEAGLRQLTAANLLEGAPPVARRTFSRRKVVGVATPLILSVAVPPASAVVSPRVAPRPVKRKPAVPRPRSKR